MSRTSFCVGRRPDESLLMSRMDGEGSVMPHLRGTAYFLMSLEILDGQLHAESMVVRSGAIETFNGTSFHGGLRLHRFPVCVTGGVSVN